ncbi:MAG: site-specific integrase [Actinomycetota bacterium]|nr:site-specific integrase [Actinomycetota bacterium]
MTRRANGEGSIFKERDGWRAQVSYTDPQTGRRRRQSVSGPTQADVRAKVRAVRRRLDEGAPARDAAVTFGAVCESWLTATLPASARRPSTQTTYTYLARGHLLPRLGHLRLDRLAPSDVDRLVLDMRRAGSAASTIRQTYTVLRAILDAAVRDGLVRRNVAAQVARPPVPRTDAAYLSLPQLQALLATTAGTRLHALVLLLVTTGLRRGEALGLGWAAIDLDAGTARVTRSLTRTPAGLAFTPPKSERSRRTVALPAATVTALREHRRAQAVEQIAAGSAWAGWGLVFCTEIGTPLDPRNVSRWYSTVASRAGVPGGLHTLRHSAASLWVASGTHLRVISESLGHSSVAITGDVYAHVGAELQRDAADRAAQVLGL